MRLLNSVRAKLITANGHQHARRIIVSGTFCALLTGCATPGPTVPVPVTVAGPPTYIPIPVGLLTCEDVGEPPGKGQTLEELYAWARLVRTEAIKCQARLTEARALATPPK